MGDEVDTDRLDATKCLQNHIRMHGDINIQIGIMEEVLKVLKEPCKLFTDAKVCILIIITIVAKNLAI